MTEPQTISSPPNSPPNPSPSSSSEQLDFGQFPVEAVRRVMNHFLRGFERSKENSHESNNNSIQPL